MQSKPSTEHDTKLNTWGYTMPMSDNTTTGSPIQPYKTLLFVTIIDVAQQLGLNKS